MPLEPISIARAKVGKGVFATRHIKAGELICVMKGDKVSSKQLSIESARRRNILVDPLQIDNDTYLLLSQPYLYINHSCDPNAGLKNSVNLTAITNINKGEEILYDYSTTWYDGMECKCGSKNCRKHISDYFTIPLRIRKKYKVLEIVPKFIPDN